MLVIPSFFLDKSMFATYEFKVNICNDLKYFSTEYEFKPVVKKFHEILSEQFSIVYYLPFHSTILLHA